MWENGRKEIVLQYEMMTISFKVKKKSPRDYWT